MQEPDLAQRKLGEHPETNSERLTIGSVSVRRAKAAGGNF